MPVAPTLMYRDPDTQAFMPLGGGGPPIGVIVPFAGSAVPEGWAVCNGTAHGSAKLLAVIGSATTPDLRNRFIVNTGGGYAAGAVGGAATVTLTYAQSGNPSHGHTASAGYEGSNHTHTQTTNQAGSHTHATQQGNYVYYADMSNTAGGQWIGENNGGGGTTDVAAGGHAHAAIWSSGESVAHSHGVTVNAAVANATLAHNNLPPYYAMMYIIRAF